ncbi:MAG: alpha-hydroxy-acid oxidizing protein, partial [Acidimicrobiales bacterium]
MIRDDASLDLIPASVDDYRELARRRLPRQVFDYLDGGAFSELTLAANRDDLGRVQFRQRVLRDVSTRSLTTRVLGTDLSMPVVLAPIGFGGMMARRAEVSA